MLVQPTGTVTLPFTDVEGSTRLLERLGAEQAAEALALHRVLREAFERHDGCDAVPRPRDGLRVQDEDLAVERRLGADAVDIGNSLAVLGIATLLEGPAALMRERPGEDAFAQSFERGGALTLREVVELAAPLSQASPARACSTGSR